MLRLVSSDDQPALAIRDHLVPIVRRLGSIEVQRDEVRCIAWCGGVWELRHWTPFRDLRADEASSPGYRHALERQHGQQDLSYGLEVRFIGTEVLRILWADNGRVEVACFARGAWEAEALAF